MVTKILEIIVLKNDLRLVQVFGPGLANREKDKIIPSVVPKYRIVKVRFV